MVTKVLSSSTTTTSKSTSNIALCDLCDVNQTVTPDNGNVLIGNGAEYTTLDLASQAARDAFTTDIIDVINDYVNDNGGTILSCQIIDWTNCPAGTIPVAALGSFTAGAIPSSAIDFTTGTIPTSAITFVDDTIAPSSINWAAITAGETAEIIANAGTNFDSMVSQSTITGVITHTSVSGVATNLNVTSTDAGNLLLTGTDGGSYLAEPVNQLP